MREDGSFREPKELKAEREKRIWELNQVGKDGLKLLDREFSQM